MAQKTMIYKTLYKKSTDWATQTTLKLEVNSGAPGGIQIPIPLVISFVLFKTGPKQQLELKLINLPVIYHKIGKDEVLHQFDRAYA